MADQPSPLDQLITRINAEGACIPNPDRIALGAEYNAIINTAGITADQLLQRLQNFYDDTLHIAYVHHTPHLRAPAAAPPSPASQSRRRARSRSRSRSHSPPRRRRRPDIINAIQVIPSALLVRRQLYDQIEARNIGTNRERGIHQDAQQLLNNVLGLTDLPRIAFMDIEGKRNTKWDTCTAQLTKQRQRFHDCALKLSIIYDEMCSSLTAAYYLANN